MSELRSMNFLDKHGNVKPNSWDDRKECNFKPQPTKE